MTLLALAFTGSLDVARFVMIQVADFVHFAANWWKNL
jgi:hypothetical protein